MRLHFVFTCLFILLAKLSFCQLTDDVVKDLAPDNFHKDFNNYNQESAVFMAHLSGIVYESDSTINEHVKQLNKIYPEANYRYKFVEHTASSSQGLLFGNKNFIVIAFRGTQEKEDVLVDAQLLGIRGKLDDSRSSAFPHLPAGHAGFRRSLMNLISPAKANIFGELDAFLTAVKVEKKEAAIYLTGHSLGAALSNLFVLPLKNRGYNYKGSYNFAPPLGIANSAAQKMINDPSIHNLTYDIVNNTDYVTSMPKYSARRMKHIGKYYRICSFTTKEPLMYTENESAYKIGFFKRLSLKKVRIDKHHFLNSYVEGVKGSKNTNEQISSRSGSLGECSCLDPKC